MKKGRLVVLSLVLVLMVALLPACATPAPAPAPAPPPAPAPTPAPPPAPAPTPAPPPAPTPTPAPPPAPTPVIEWLFHWTRTSGNTMVLDSIFQPGGDFEHMLTEATGGRVKLNLVTGMYKTGDVGWAAADGRLALGREHFTATAADYPLWDIGSLPLLFRSMDEFVYALRSPKVHAIWQKSFADKNLVFLGVNSMPLQYLWTKKPLTKVDEFKGLKVRTSTVIQLETITLLEGKGLTIPTEEQTMALERGIIDAQVTSAQWGFLSHAYKVTSYVNLWPLTPICGAGLLLNKDAFDALPDDLKKIVLEVGRKTEDMQLYTAHREEFLSKRAMVELGGHVEIPSDEEIEKAAEIARPVIDNWLDRAGSYGTPLLEAVEEFLKEYRTKPPLQH